MPLCCRTPPRFAPARILRYQHQNEKKRKHNTFARSATARIRHTDDAHATVQSTPFNIMAAASHLFFTTMHTTTTTTTTTPLFVGIGAVHQTLCNLCHRATATRCCRGSVRTGVTSDPALHSLAWWARRCTLKTQHAGRGSFP